ncbi:hypothetical protein [Pasteuria penetrans]|uniref:hypothetical protein n=1 Tax=Pasteuria penetrans TaxID=86005 RepID=UPI000FBDCAC0|nr:hypothetical protein [Pasteuria penetrans]
MDPRRLWGSIMNTASRTIRTMGMFWKSPITIHLRYDGNDCTVYRTTNITERGRGKIK